MTPIEAALAEVARLREKFASYDGGDRPMSPPVSLMRELNAAEERLRQLRTAEYEAKRKRADEAAVASRIFEPTTEEIAACPVLADVAGKPEREAVLMLARRLQMGNTILAIAGEAAGTVLRLDWGVRDETSLGAQALTDLAVAHGYMAPTFDAKKRSASQPQRPRVGPWIAEGGCRSRYDDRGEEVAAVWTTDDGWCGRANRAFAHSVLFEEDGRTEEQARAAVDAVLAEWAELEVA